jgi:spore germination protein GerM
MASEGAPGWGSYSVDLVFDPPAQPADAVVRVFSDSPRDGSVINPVEVPVRVAAGFVPPGTRAVLVYFAQSSPADVEYVAVERRVAATPALGRAALDELLKGPTDEERARGLGSPIPAGTTLRSLTIADGVATADFDRQLLYQMGGSARVQAGRDCIGRTLMQFPSVRTVELSVEGRSEGILQP